MLCLPGGRGAVFVVGVGVVVVDVLPGEDGGARGAAHGRGHEGVDEVGPALLHDAPRLVHHLHGTCNQSEEVRRGPADLQRVRPSRAPQLETGTEAP